MFSLKIMRSFLEKKRKKLKIEMTREKNRLMIILCPRHALTHLRLLAHRQSYNLSYDDRSRHKMMNIEHFL